ncbi:MAG: aminopeptidase P family protein [Pseudomonadota bacterium]
MSNDELSRLLGEAGSAYQVDTLKELVAGVLAAPLGPDSEAWMALVVAEPSERLKAELGAFMAALAATQTTARADYGARLAGLRDRLAAQGLAGVLVPHADEHQGEYRATRAERLAWLTGFTGSMGSAVVLRDKAALFVDGRYTLQAADQVDGALFEVRHLIDEPPSKWAAGQLDDGAKLGYDPWLHTEDQVAVLERALAAVGATLVACPVNLIDEIWSDQPAAPIAPVVPHPEAYSGRAPGEKRLEVAERLKAAGADSALLSLPDSIMWLLDVRGGDVGCTPLALSFALLQDDGTLDWFIDRRKLTSDLERHLGNGVTVRAPEEIGPRLDELVAVGKRILVDPASAPAWVAQRVRAAGGTPVKASDPCQLPKARKNPVELEGTRQAHRRDGAALTGFLAWIAEEAPRRLSNGGLGELEAAEKLAGFRAKNEQFRGLSFETISGAGANGAIVHYRASPETERHLGDGDLLLVDSGAQYLDGTTDVTRTIAVGQPSDEMRDRFTRVLKGHIAVATARFPHGTSGSQLDILARAALWQAGLDYDHGTGHGVGSYLGVHEGPQRVSKMPNRVPLEPGMIVSNEPGYYKTGAYGIRIENLVAVIESPVQDGDEREMLAFETLTLAPIDLALVEPALMRPDELAWLDDYHARVRERLAPLVDAATGSWLDGATRPIGQPATR